MFLTHHSLNSWLSHSLFLTRSDVIDVFEGGVGKHNEDGAVLKTWITGARFAALMTNLERGIAVSEGVA